MIGFRSFCVAALALLLLARPVPAAEPDELARFDARLRPKDRQHWAFQSIGRPSPPPVKDTTWVRNPIDRFILAQLEAKGWKPSPAAEPRALLRRIFLDLAGLPPTLSQQEAFLENSSPEALDRVCTELLSRPQYGERWGRHWLDLVRYAETNGYERDATKPHAWRFRDYVIKSFNDDKPFDRFILEQIAGDELPDASTETVLATGFNRLGPWDDEPADPKEDRFDQLDDIVSTTSQVFLGLTLGCARCHNHKFEPLSSLDYYRMVAVFNTLKRPQNGRTELDLPAGSRSAVAANGQRDRRLAELHQHALSMHFAIDPLLRLRAAADDLEIRRLRESTPDLPRGYFLHEPSPKPLATPLLRRGSAHNPGPEVQPGAPAVLVARQPEFLPPTAHTSQRRLSLARWIASKDNPLAARVIVNRVWMYHFGEGLVRTPSDFGTQGEKPTHPELLDWLAGWFIENGWSIKKLHRLIVASNTYRMSKRQVPQYMTADPEDRLWWRVPYRRLEVEAIRDGILAVSGQLNPKMGGPSVLPAVPKEALEGSSDPDKIWHPSSEQEASRRTVYVFLKRSMIVPMLEVLDVCDTTRSAARRSVTSVAPQALTLLNSDFTNRQAGHFADRLLREAGPDPVKQIEHAYLLALGRPPSERERSTLLRFLQREGGQRAARVQMCRVMFNLNEFVYSD